MAADDLLTDDLHELLRTFPNGDLRDLVGVLKKHSSWSLFPAPRAYAAHYLTNDADYSAHAHAIAQEIFWWGSNDLSRQVGSKQTWREIVRDTAARAGVAKDERSDDLTAWQLEGAILRKALVDWENLTPEQRENLLRDSGADYDAARGAALYGVGVLAQLGGRQLLAFLAARGAGFAAVAPVLAPIAPVLGPLAAAAGAAWAVADLAGPGYRVLRPVVLMVAYTRQRLREDRAAAEYKD